MLKAIKQNKVYPVDETNKEAFLADGFDIYQDGELIEKSPKATIPYSEYSKLMKENEVLHERIAELEAEKGCNEENKPESTESEKKEKPSKKASE